MKRYWVPIVSLSLLAAPAAAGEIHLISRDHAGAFLASHQLYTNKRRGMTRVDYCGRTYYAYWNTLYWLDLQDYEGHRLGVEFSNGDNWRLICRNPQKQIAAAPEAANSRARRQAAADDRQRSWIQLLNKRPSRF